MEYLLRASLGNIVLATALAVVTAAMGPSLRRWPALRHCRWLLVLVKLVTPPLWTVLVAWLPGPNASEPAQATIADFEDSVPGSWRASLDTTGERLVFLDRPADAPPVQEIALDPLVAETFLHEN